MKANVNDPIYIAIADDDKFQRFLLHTLIRKDRRLKLLFDACDGQDFMAKLKLCTRLPNVCIIDLKMPRMDGVETCACIKRYNERIKIIGYTSSDDLQAISRMKNKGAEEVVTKGNVHDLLECVLISYLDRAFL
ncbi:response regulator transcription factor [Olivibacter sp. CPCC 100613]|uniref:response regulator n=1 Tax=Olivibacter sp. CPCC 100613 TaxID=3079931 RepID=UPI002FFCEC55